MCDGGGGGGGVAVVDGGDDGGGRSGARGSSGNTAAHIRRGELWTKKRCSKWDGKAETRDEMT